MVELIIGRDSEAASELMRSHIANSLTASALAAESIMTTPAR